MNWALTIALFYALGFGVAAFVLPLLTIDAVSLKTRMRAAVVNGLVNFIIDLLATWFAFSLWLPSFSTEWSAGYFVPLFFGSLLLTVSTWFASKWMNEYDGLGSSLPWILAGLLLLGVVGNEVGTLFFVQPRHTVLNGKGAFCDPDGVNVMMNLLQTNNAPVGSLPDADPNHLIRVTPDVASYKAGQVIGNGDLGSYLQLGTPFLQKLDGNWVYVVDLQPSSFQSFYAAGGYAPGYVVVNAEDPQAQAVLRTGFRIQYVPNLGFWFPQDLNRYVYYNFTLPQARDLVVKDLDTMEVRDGDGRPFYTGTLEEPVAGVTGYKVVGMVAVDAQTGQITWWKSLSEIPSWVDRVFPQDYVQSWASDWWTQYAHHYACQLFSQKGQLQVDSTSYQLTGNGDATYVLTYTSPGNDTSLNGELVVNPTTGTVTNIDLTSIHGSTQSAAKALVEKKLQQLFRGASLSADLCQLQQVLSTPVWYCVVNQGNTNTGVAMVQVQYTTDVNRVLYATDNASLVAQLQQQLAGTNSNSGLPSTQGTKSFTGVVTHVSNVLVTDTSGTTYRVFQLHGKDIPDSTVFWVAMPNSVAALMSVGDTVTVFVSLTDSGGQLPTGQHVVVSNIVDNNLPIGTSQG